MGRDRAADGDVGLAPLSDDELVAWGEELRRATADGPRHLAPRPLRAQGPAVQARPRRTEPLRAGPLTPETPPPVTPPPVTPAPVAPAPVAPAPVAPFTTWSARPRGRPLVAEAGISTGPA